MCDKNPMATYTYFYGHSPALYSKGAPHHVLSQWWHAPFTDPADGVLYATSEHYMMAKKAQLFEDGEALQDILAASHPRKAKALGRRVRNFDEERWCANRLAIVQRASFLKFSNPDLTAILLATGDSVLAEASPHDTIWGIGMSVKAARASNGRQDWKGLNLLGAALEHARELLRAGVTVDAVPDTVSAVAEGGRQGT